MPSSVGRERPGMISPLNERERIRHKVRNRLQSLFLLASMALLLSLCGWTIAGGEGIFWALVMGGVSLVFGPQVSPWLTLRMYGAIPIHPAEMPALSQVLREISARAGLPHPPRLYYVPTRVLNAFAVGRREQAVVALTDGLLRALTLRELAGVLAHEISHIRNNDLGIMTLADVMNRLTSAMWLAGIVLLIMSLPVLVLEGNLVLWFLVALLVLSPTIASLLQLALSRTREYDADLDAAGLTGDPRGLASALQKLERYQGGLFETFLLPGRRVPQPSLLRTHPPTRDRIARLLTLEPEAAPRIPGPASEALPARFRAVPGGPRWRATGLWY